MSKVFEKASDLHVRAVYVYKKSSDTYAYSDSATTKKISATDLEDMFNKGMIIVVSGAYYKPVKCSTASSVCTVTYVTADATTATTAVLATLRSE